MNDAPEDDPLPQEPRNVFDSSYDAAEFKDDLTSGQLRWFFSILALIGLGLLIYCLVNPNAIVIYFPISVKGRVAVWLIAFVFILWLTLAIKNWTSRFRQRSRS